MNDIIEDTWGYPLIRSKTRDQVWIWIHVFSAKLSNFKSIFITQERREWQNKEFINNVIKNFDPFLSQGKKIKAILTEEGKRILASIALNRPETISCKGNIYEFKCSEQQAKRYFAYFFDEIEILEPVVLRQWFIAKYKSSLNNYKKNK